MGLGHPQPPSKGGERLSDKDRKIQNLQKLGLTPDEIAEVLADDERIDKGEKLFELPEELQKGAKKARTTGNRKPTTTKRERAPDTDKRELIALIAETVENVTDDGMVNVTNPEREMIFTKNGKKYKIVLSAPRS